MKVLIVGNGGREHALAWKFSQSKRITGLYCVPGNAGTADLGQNMDHLSLNDIDGIVNAAKVLEIDLVFVGPEAALADGLCDKLSKVGIRAVGPDARCAQLESSKTFSKDFLNRNRIPTAIAKTFKPGQLAQLQDFLNQNPNKPWVVKKSGLAAGKGVLESDNTEELLSFAKEHMADDEVLIEEYLRGYEVSIFTISDGISYKVLPAAADYKKAGEGNTGPNTGGMGAICPVPWLTKASLDLISKEVIAPTFDALTKDNLMYKGILYFGIMVCADGPKVLEFNVRFGDPEAQVLIPLIETDFCDLFGAVADGQLDKLSLKISQKSALAVVVAALGYPGDYPKHLPVKLDFINHETDRFVFHASTLNEGKNLLTNGGRCFTLVGLGTDHLRAAESAYSLENKLEFEGAWTRPDIGSNVYSQKF